MSWHAVILNLRSIHCAVVKINMRTGKENKIIQIPLCGDIDARVVLTLSKMRLPLHVKNVPQIHHLKAQLALRKEEALAEADEFREHSLRQAEEVRTSRTPGWRAEVGAEHSLRQSGEVSVLHRLGLPRAEMGAECDLQSLQSRQASKLRTMAELCNCTTEAAGCRRTVAGREQGRWK